LLVATAWRQHAAVLRLTRIAAVIVVSLVMPNRRQRPAPVVLSRNYFGNHTLLRDPAIALSTNWMPERGTGVVNSLSTEASRGTWADVWRIE
jgi:hypothetical protein